MRHLTPDELATDTPMAHHPSAALVAFAVAAALAGGQAAWAWLRLALAGSPHPGHYHGLRR